MSKRSGENLKFQELPSQGVGLESEIYARRFGSKELRARELTWSILCEEFFQKYIPYGVPCFFRPPCVFPTPEDDLIETDML